MERGFCHERADGVEFLTIPAFEKAGFRAVFSTRIGGVSEGGLSSLNLGLSRGEPAERTRENYRRICAAAGLEEASLVMAAQTHTANVRRVFFADRGEGLLRREFADVDGLATDERGVTLVTFHADCTPIFLADPRTRAMALLHAGWRGTAAGMAQAGVDFLTRTFGARPQELLAAIGPSAGGCCYEVSDEVAQALAVRGGACCRPGRPGHQMADLWEANRRQLLDAGVREENLTICGECTVCCPELYYSHRVQGADRGSMAAFLTRRDV